MSVDQPKSETDVVPKVPDIQVLGKKTSKSASDIAPPLGPNVLSLSSLVPLIRADTFEANCLTNGRRKIGGNTALFSHLVPKHSMIGT